MQPGNHFKETEQQVDKQYLMLRFKQVRLVVVEQVWKEVCCSGEDEQDAAETVGNRVVFHTFPHQ